MPTRRCSSAMPISWSGTPHAWKRKRAAKLMPRRGAQPGLLLAIQYRDALPAGGYRPGQLGAALHVKRGRPVVGARFQASSELRDRRFEITVAIRCQTAA